VAVRIRMKQMGRKHRPFYRICATDIRTPRDGRVLEQLGTYDPMIPETDARVVLDLDRIQHWLDHGATPSDNVKTFLKKYGKNGTHVEAQKQAVDRLAQKRRRNEPMQVAPKATKQKRQPEQEAAAPAPKSDAQKIRDEAAAKEAKE
jgi:small subunit ribosomal protein S16